MSVEISNTHSVCKRQRLRVRLTIAGGIIHKVTPNTRRASIKVSKGEDMLYKSSEVGIPWGFGLKNNMTLGIWARPWGFGLKNNMTLGIWAKKQHDPGDLG